MGDGRSTGAQELNKTRPSESFTLAKKVLDLILAQWLIIGFGLSCLLAYLFPGNNDRWPRGTLHTTDARAEHL